jgi:hypothetical protein
MLNSIYKNTIIFFLIFLLFFFINCNLKKSLIKENFENNYILPKVIYGYWDNLEGNLLINAHIDTWRRNISSEWKIELISKQNILNYVDIDFYNKYKNLPAFRFSDFLRVYLLSKNGGVWMDASTIIINGQFLNDYYNEMYKNNYDLLVYELKGHSIPNQPYLENWFIMCPKNSKIITDLYNQFSNAFDMGFINYKNKMLKPNIDLSNTIKNGNGTYHMQHAIIHYLLKINKYNINIKDSYESMFKAQKINNWNNDKLINYILNNNDWSGYYAIKLVGFNRKAINDNDTFIKKLNSF